MQGFLEVVVQPTTCHVKLLQQNVFEWFYTEMACELLLNYIY